MTNTENILILTQDTITELNNANFPLSAVLRNCIRIARLRNDFENHFWLEFEMISIEDLSRLDFINKEIRSHFTKKEFEIISK